MPRVALTLFGVLLAGLISVSVYSPASADTVIESQTVVNGYPSTITFKITAKSDQQITDLSLRYAITGSGSSALSKPKDFQAATNLSAEVVLQVNSSSVYIPVGSNFTYHWEVTTADGNTVSGEEQTFFYLPTGQDWKNVSNDFMTVYYHGDRESIANAYLQAGQETYDKIGKQLYGVTLKVTPVKVIMFADEKESDQARPGNGGAFDAAVTTCGTKVTVDIILLIPIACGSADRTDTLRHEFGHILNEIAGEGALGKLPSWLDEGAAVYAQSSPGDYQQAFVQAAQQNRLIPFDQMSVAPTTARQVDVFYGESWAMVSFLVDKGGPSTFARFMSTIKSGKRFDQALTEVYEFADIGAFQSAFNQAVGVTQQASPTPRPSATTPSTRAATATATPRGLSAAATSNKDDNSIGTGTIVIGGIAVLFVLAALLAFLVSMMMANNRRAAVANQPTPPPPPDEWRPPSGPAND
ncbi:MAG: peptidase MA family metallohydrolase [Dehalococcoidia bacterium]